MSTPAISSHAYGVRIRAVPDAGCLGLIAPGALPPPALSQRADVSGRTPRHEYYVSRLAKRNEREEDGRNWSSVTSTRANSSERPASSRRTAARSAAAPRTACELAEIAYEPCTRADRPARRRCPASCSRSARRSPSACCTPAARPAASPSWTHQPHRQHGRRPVPGARRDDAPERHQIRVSAGLARIVGCSREMAAASSSSSRKRACFRRAQDDRGVCDKL